MYTELQTELIPRRTEKKYVEKIKITNRDLEIIRFCLEMRFATIEQIYQRFFKSTYSGTVSQCDRWAKERLFQLRQADYLKLQKNFSTGQNLIVPTLKGYMLVRNLLYTMDLPKPVNYVDFRQFEHDRLLTDCRLLLENNKEIKSWISERSMQARAELITAFASDSLPDALCITPNESAFFFELELSLKTKDRIKKKVRRYVHLLRSEKVIFPGLNQVRFVCSKSSIFNAIEKETKIYGSLFKVQMIDTFFNINLEAKNEIL